MDLGSELVGKYNNVGAVGAISDHKGRWISGECGEAIFPFPIKRLCAGFLIGFFLLFGGGCGHVEPGEEGVAGGLDHTTFKNTIQAIMDNNGCSQGGCHFRDKANPNIGGPGGSLRLFICTVSNPCTPGELLANHDSAAGMSNTVNPSNSKLLTKPLIETGGGVPHAGGDIFLSTTDLDYLAVLSWIQSPL